MEVLVQANPMYIANKFHMSIRVYFSQAITHLFNRYWPLCLAVMFTFDYFK